MTAQYFARILIIGALAASVTPLSVVALAASPPAAHDNEAGEAVASAVQADSELAASVPAAIRHRGTLIIGAQMQQQPEDFYAEDGRTPIGFEVDLAHALAQVLGLRVEYQTMAFDALIPALRSGRVDVTMSAMNDTRPREKTISFVDYFNAGITMLAQKGNPDHITGPESLCGQAVSVQAGTTQQAFAESQNAVCKAAGKAPVAIVISSSTEQQEESLRTGRFAVILDDTPTAIYTAQVAGNGRFFQAIDYPPINGGPYGIGVAKENPALLSVIQKAMQKLMDTGVYGKILAAWGMTAGAIPKATVNAG
ncbi:MAG TPA: ABC transporter substrate-binding protein [Acetobacteraceae bacterium]|jgi:polar amino acid transport system substrate-binding protein|nr:ABC transporter substrate-binding protein [Acetobacteraceae bacterium]